MTRAQRHAAAVENVRERLDILVALARHPEAYPLERYLAHASDTIVDAVLALTKPRPDLGIPHTVDAADTDAITRAITDMERLR